MWLVRHDYLLTPPSGSNNPHGAPAPGIRYGRHTELTFVDDANLTLAGNTSC
jgi:hypothetical protein